MRQLNPSSNLVLAVLAGLGLLGTLRLDWWAAPATDTTATDGPVEQAAFHVSHVFSTPTASVTGSDGLGDARVALFGLVGLVALLAVAVAINGLRRPAEDLLRAVAIGAPILFIIVCFAHPGTTADVSIHSGLLAGLVLCLLMANAAWSGATMRTKKAAPVRPRYGSAAR